MKNMQNKGNTKDESWEHRLDRCSCGNDTSHIGHTLIHLHANNRMT